MACIIGGVSRSDTSSPWQETDGSQGPAGGDVYCPLLEVHRNCLLILLCSGDPCSGVWVQYTWYYLEYLVLQSGQDEALLDHCLVCCSDIQFISPSVLNLIPFLSLVSSQFKLVAVLEEINIFLFFTLTSEIQRTNFPIFTFRSEVLFYSTLRLNIGVAKLLLAPQFLYRGTVGLEQYLQNHFSTSHSLFSSQYCNLT